MDQPEESIYSLDEESIQNESEMGEYYGESPPNGSIQCTVSDEMIEEEEEEYGTYQSSNATSESVMGVESIPIGIGEPSTVCQNIHDTEACHNAVLSAQYEKGYSKEEALRRLATRAFLIPVQTPEEIKSNAINSIIPTEASLKKHLKNLLGTTRVKKMENIRKAQEKLRDYFGATVSVETMNKIKKIREKHRLAKLEHVDAKSLTIEREAKVKGYMAPRVPIKHLRRGFREKENLEQMPEPDFRRMKNTLWRIEIENYEMVYPVTCEMRKKHKLIKAAESTHLGPGSYSIDEYYNIQQKKKLQLGKGYLNKQTNRFSNKEAAIKHAPGPTTYGNPYEILEKKSLTGAKRTLFETASPFKKLLPDSTPDCCCYDPQLSSIEEMQRSKKGLVYPDKIEDKVKLHKDKNPRGLIKFGYMATPTSKNVPESTFKPKGFVDLINDPRRRLYGIFSTVDRDAYDGGVHSVRRPRLEHSKFRPGPGTYTLGSSLKILPKFKGDVKKENEKICCTMKTKYEEPANPLYYNERRGFRYLYKNIKGNGARSSFKASERGMKLEKLQFLSERTRAINIPADEAKEKEQE